MTDRPTIEDAKTLQNRLGIRDTHVVWLDLHGFTIAHTDEERLTIRLEDCPLHKWLYEYGLPDECYDDAFNGGWFIARPREHDPVSESFRSDDSGWSFEAIKPQASD